VLDAMKRLWNAVKREAGDMWKRIHPEMSASDKFPKLGFGPMTLWTLMLPHSDSRGRYWASPSWIKGQVLTMFEDVSVQDVKAALLKLAEVRLIHLYDVAGKTYLVFHDHEDHSGMGSMRYAAPKWPAPPDSLCQCANSTRRAVAQELATQEAMMPDSPAARIIHLIIQNHGIACKGEIMRNHADAWIHAHGFEKVEQIVTNVKNVQGKTFFEIHDAFFKTVDRNGKPKTEAKSFTCRSCGDTGTICVDVRDGQRVMGPCNSCQKKTA